MNKAILCVTAILAFGLGYLLSDDSEEVPDREHWPAAPSLSPAPKSEIEPADRSFAGTAATEPSSNVSTPIESSFDRQLQAYQVAATSTALELQQAADHMLRSAHRQQQQLGKIYLDRLAELDLAAALTVTEELPESFHKQNLLAQLVLHWAYHDRTAALAYYHGLDNPSLKLQISKVLASESNLLSPADLESLRNQLPPGIQYELDLHLAKTQPLDSQSFQQAWQTVQSDEDVHRLSSKLGYLAIQDPDSALQIIQSLPDSPRKRRLLPNILSTLAYSHPETALEYVQLYGESDPELELTVLSGYSQIDPEAALPLIEAYSARTGNTHLLPLTLRQWVQKDPAAAKAYFDGLTDPQIRMRAMSSMAFGYITSNPEEGLRWVMSQPENVDVSQMVAGLFSYSLVAAEAAEKLLGETYEPAKRRLLVSGLVEARMRDDPVSGMEWLELNADPAHLPELRRQAMNNWLSSDWPDASQSLAQYAEDSDYKEVFEVVGYHVRGNPASAADWAEALPDSPNREAAIASILPRLAQYDFDRARDLLLDMPAGQMRDRAGRGILSQLARSDPDSAAALQAELNSNEE